MDPGQERGCCYVSMPSPSMIYLVFNLSNCSTTSKESRLHEFLDTENVPDLSAEEIDAIEAAGAKLHKRVYLPHLFDE